MLLTRIEQLISMVWLRRVTLTTVVLTEAFALSPVLWVMSERQLLHLPYLTPALIFWQILSTLDALGQRWGARPWIWPLVRCNLTIALVQWVWIALIVLWSNLPRL